MTASLLRGFREVSDVCVFAAIVGDDVNRESVLRYYGGFADEIVFVRRITTLKKDKYSKYLSMLKCCMFARFPEEKQLAELIDGDTFMVSQSPAIDAALLCKRLMRLAKPKRYIQYWGDPLALSLITPEQYSATRLPFYLIERRLFRFADSIVYGTKPLYKAQKQLFSSLSACARMGYCDVPYLDRGDEEQLGGELTFGYLGNYYSKIRDLRPFYEAFRDFDRGRLIVCGSSDLELEPTERVTVMRRVPQSEVHETEKLLNVEVCLLNRIGIQIPGKIFYEVNTDKVILVITDGPRAEDAREYLDGFKRFVFCENNRESIRAALNRIADGETPCDRSQIYRLSPGYVADSILKGGFTD